MANYIHGVPELTAALAGLERAFPVEAGKALYQEALKVEKLSRELTPVLTGALRGSHVTAQPVVDAGHNVYVRISVGGPAAGYAVHVHENLDSRHEVGQAKYLEGAVNASRDSLITGVADRLRRFLEKT